MLTVERFGYSDEEYLQMAAIEAAIFKMPAYAVEEYRHDDESRRPEYLFRREWITRDGERIAFVEWGQNPARYHPQKVDMRIFVNPTDEAADIRPFFLAYLLEEMRDHDLIAVYSDMLESCEEAMRFFEAYGFREVARDAISKLDLGRWDADKFAGVLARVQEQGIRIVPLRSLQEEDPEGWAQKLYELEMAISRDIPTTGEKQAHTFDSWQRARAGGPGFDPDGWFVALDGEQYVAESQGYVNTLEPAWFENGVTGVRRAYRRRGIATAVKVHLLRFAQGRGAQAIATSNDAANPMYALNVKLGFEPEPAWVRTEKAL